MNCKKLLGHLFGDNIDTHYRIGTYRPPKWEEQPGANKMPAADARLKPRTNLGHWVAGAHAGVDADSNAGEPEQQSEQRNDALKLIKKAREIQMVDVDIGQLGLRSLPEHLGDYLRDVKKLYLSQNNLQSLPNSIGKLTKLVVLDASANLLTHLPAEIGQLKNLRLLDLKGNLLRRLPDEIGEIHHLTNLHLDGNRLQALPGKLGSLSNLRVLTASFNQLAGQVPEDLNYLEQLCQLDLSYNQIWNLPPKWDKLFARLQVAKLDHNQLQALPDSFTHPYQKSDLDVSYNPLISLPVKYGGFTYPWKSNDNIRSSGRKGKHLTVNVKGTDIRQGLVNEGRLLQDRNRGIYREGPGLRYQERPMPPPQFDDELRSELSARQYVMEHQEYGGLEGVELARQRAEEFQFTFDERLDKRDAWVGDLANGYANLNPGGHSPGGQQDRPMDDGAWPTLGAAMPPGGYPAGLLAKKPEPTFAPNAAGPTYVPDYPVQGARAKARTQVGLNYLRRELDTLPTADKDAVLNTLASVPEHLVEATLAEVMEAMHLNDPSMRFAGARPPLGAAAAEPPPHEADFYARPAQTAFAQGSAQRPAHFAPPPPRHENSFYAPPAQAAFMQGSTQRPAHFAPSPPRYENGFYAPPAQAAFAQGSTQRPAHFAPPPPRYENDFYAPPAQAAFSQGGMQQSAHFGPPFAGGGAAFSSAERRAEALRNLPDSWPRGQALPPPPWERVPARTAVPEQDSGMFRTEETPWMEHNGVPGDWIEETNARPVLDTTLPTNEPTNSFFEYLWYGGDKPYSDD